mgnify:FL=1
MTTASDASTIRIIIADDDPIARAAIKSMFDEEDDIEVVAVAAALGHDLATDDAPDPVAAALRMADAQPAGATTSMQRDIASGLPSELDAQLGALCRAGDEAGVPTPVLDLALSVLAPREAAARAGA